jgi:hypothetical protein
MDGNFPVAPTGSQVPAYTPPYTPLPKGTEVQASDTGFNNPDLTSPTRLATARENSGLNRNGKPRQEPKTRDPKKDDPAAKKAAKQERNTAYRDGIAARASAAAAAAEPSTLQNIFGAVSRGISSIFGRRDVENAAPEKPIVVRRGGVNQQGTTTTTKAANTTTLPTTPPTSPITNATVVATSTATAATSPAANTTAAVATSTNSTTTETSTTTPITSATSTATNGTNATTSQTSTSTSKITSTTTSTQQATISPDQGLFLKDSLEIYSDAFRSLPESEKTAEIKQFLGLYDSLVNNIAQHKPLYLTNANLISQVLHQIGQAATSTVSTTTAKETTQAPTINPDFIKVRFEAEGEIIARLNATDSSAAFAEWRAAYEEIANKLKEGESVSLAQWTQYNERFLNFQLPTTTAISSTSSSAKPTTTTPPPTIAPALLAGLRPIYEGYYRVYNAEGSGYLIDQRVNGSVALFNTVFENSFAQANQTQLPVLESSIIAMNQMIRDINAGFAAPTTTTTTTTAAPATIGADQLESLRKILALNNDAYIQPYLAAHPDEATRTVEFAKFYKLQQDLNAKINPEKGPALSVEEQEFTNYSDAFTQSLNGTTLPNRTHNNNSSATVFAATVSVLVVAAAAAIAAGVWAKVNKKYCFSDNAVGPANPDATPVALPATSARRTGPTAAQAAVALHPSGQRQGGTSSV